jgi:tripartite-type tricarboxylate transporter receptor subunit TctC
MSSTMPALRMMRTASTTLVTWLCVALIAGTAHAYPDRPIRVLISFPAGGSTDAMARIVQPGIEKLLGQPLILENRAGAAGLIAADAVAKAAPDGYVIGLGGTAALGSTVGFQATMSAEPRKDLAPVTGLAGSPFILAATPSLPAKSVQEVIALAKARGSALTIGHGGNGTLMHLTAAMFARAAGIKLTMVPYRGMAPVVTDLIGGHASLGIIDPPSGMAAIAAGQIRPVAMTSSKRFARMPDIPTVAESGLADFESNGAFGIVVPAGTPPDVVEKLNRAFATVLADPDVIARIRELGGEPMPMTPQAFGAFIRKEMAKWQKVITTAKIAPQ